MRELGYPQLLAIIDKFAPREILVTRESLDYLRDRSHPSTIGYDSSLGPTITMKGVVVRIKDYIPRPLKGVLDATEEKLYFLPEV
jgi:hypothetical protein